MDGVVNIICAAFGTGFGVATYRTVPGIIGICRVAVFLYDYVVYFVCTQKYFISLGCQSTSF